VLTWPDAIDPSLKDSIENVLRHLMQKLCPSSLNALKQTIAAIVSAQPPKAPFGSRDLTDLDVIRHVWTSTLPSYRPWLRTLIVELAQLANRDAAGEIALAMTDWKANRELRWKIAVLEWDPEHGSLTSAELQLLRKQFKAAEGETLTTQFGRLFTWLTLTTLLRPAQLIALGAKDMHRITTHIGTTVDLCIPGAKGQALNEPRWYPIPLDLADDIDAYRERLREAMTRQGTFDKDLLDACLLPLISYEESWNQRVFAPYGAQAKTAVQRWIKSLRLHSPRTGRPLHINLRRIRHTGSTHLAMQGYPLDLIQDVLEHDSPDSARYYIDAVGAEYLPLFEKADRNLGGRFSMMRNAWFKGRVVDREGSPARPIIVPDPAAPAAVGACGKEGSCAVHPLFSCYSCQHFLAFRDADHGKVFDFLDAEYQRWRAVETSNSRSKAIKDFDRIAAGVREVIGLIDEKAPDGAS